MLPKGIDGFGNHTYTEILARPQLQPNLGTLLYHKAHKPDVHFVVDPWEHKFGDGSNVSGSEEVAPEFGIEVHF